MRNIDKVAEFIKDNKSKIIGCGIAIIGIGIGTYAGYIAGKNVMLKEIAGADTTGADARKLWDMIMKHHNASPKHRTVLNLGEFLKHSECLTYVYGDEPKRVDEIFGEDFLSCIKPYGLPHDRTVSAIAINYTERE